MKTALCLTPDLAFFRQAWFTSDSILKQGDAESFDLFIVCEPGDVAEGGGRLRADLRNRVRVLTTDFSAHDSGAPGRGAFSRAVFRRLFLDRVLPPEYERIIALDSDMMVVEPGLGRLATIDLAGAPLAAAYDMIFLMDFNGGALARRFLAHRRAIGLAPDTPYFNAGLMVIDRARWAEAQIGERAIEALLRNPERHPLMEQSALNELIAGGFAPLSPRYNFMGDFFLLDLEARLDPIVLHFVNRPKPWDLGEWRGETRFARAYREWFAASPWPEFLSEAPLSERPRRPRATSGRRAFSARLFDWLKNQRFIDQPDFTDIS